MLLLSQICWVWILYNKIFIKGTWQNDIERVLVGGEETIAGVYSLRPATTYHFRIVAVNAIGSSGPSDTITVETSEEAPSGK